MTEHATPLRRLLIVTPHPWHVPHPVNDHVAELADGIVEQREAAGGRVVDVVVAAPSTDGRARRATRRVLRDLARGGDPAELFAAEEMHAPAPGARRGSGPEHEWPLVATGLPAGPASVGLRSAMRLILDHGGVDLVHVHDPLENDLARFVVRRWQGLTVATMHEPPEQTVRAAIASPLRDRVLDGVDRWLVGSPAARAALDQTFETMPADIVDIATAAVAERPAGFGGGTGPVVAVGRVPGDEAVLRAALVELAPLLEERPELTITLLGRWARSSRPSIPRPVRGRVHVVDARTREQSDAVLAGAGCYLEPTDAHPRGAEEARAAGVPIVALGGAGDEPGAGSDLPGDLRARVAAALPEGGEPHGLPTREALATDHLAAYDEVRGRIQVHIPPPAASERACVIDLHMHTNHSWDCATDPEALLYVARKVGLTALAVTDHNEVSGAIACAEVADEYGIQVIVGEEVKTSQGEVIGLFLTERIEPGLTWVETIEQIRAQDGLVYVPHPFDRLHTIPDVGTLRDTVDEIDAFEVYNARLAFEQYNRDAERFAKKYNLIEGAGSDSHVVQGLGTAAVHMPAWDDQESFLTALRQGEILRRPKSLMYLQGLKWVNDLTGRSKHLPAEAVGRDE